MIAVWTFHVNCEAFPLITHLEWSRWTKKSLSHLYNTLDTQNYLEHIFGVSPFHIRLQIIPKHTNCFGKLLLIQQSSLKHVTQRLVTLSITLNINVFKLHSVTHSVTLVGGYKPPKK